MGQRLPGPRQGVNKHRGAVKPDRPHVDSQIHEANERFFKEDREPRERLCPVRDALQLLPETHKLEGKDSGHGCGARRSCVDA